ncbi:MAG: hypothetical protein Q8L56_15020 [Rhodocyclaceae bacterium]|nr:hypothetical protein [Rhodocyclaceae bacterium]
MLHAASRAAIRIFVSDCHPITAMRFDLQGLDVARIVGGRE